MTASPQESEKSRLSRTQDSAVHGAIGTSGSQTDATPSSRNSPTPGSMPEMPSSTSTTNAQLAFRGSRIVLRDENSGIRLSQAGGGEVVLLPPEYTPS